MPEIAVIGGSEFVMGFQLAGIKKIVRAEQQPHEKLRKLVEDPAIGIILIDEKTMDALPEYVRQDIQKLPKPVVVPLSTTETAQDALRKMIQKSIGVDVW